MDLNYITIVSFKINKKNIGHLKIFYMLIHIAKSRSKPQQQRHRVQEKKIKYIIPIKREIDSNVKTANKVNKTIDSNVSALLGIIFVRRLKVLFFFKQ